MIGLDSWAKQSISPGAFSVKRFQITLSADFLVPEIHRALMLVYQSFMQREKNRLSIWRTLLRQLTVMASSKLETL